MKFCSNFLIVSIFTFFCSSLFAHNEKIEEYVNNPWKWPALHYAIFQKDQENARLILDLMPDQLKSRTPSLKLMASHLGNDASDDYDYCIGYEEGMTAIELAFRFNDEKLATQFVLLGADPKIFRQEYDGWLSDYWETREGHVYERCKLTFPRWPLDHYQIVTPLYWAIENNNLLLVKLLIEQGADTSSVYLRSKIIVTNNEGKAEVSKKIERYSALELAVALERLEIIEILR